MIPVETWYKTYNGKLLAIIEAFKTWRYYLEGCKHEVLILTDHNNLRHFMDTKNLSSRQVRWCNVRGHLTPSRDLISHHIQQHSTKSTHCIYPLPCSWRLIFSIHQTPFIYCWESAFLHRIVEKPTSRYPICWEAYQPSSYFVGTHFSSSSSSSGPALRLLSSWF